MLRGKMKIKFGNIIVSGVVLKNEVGESLEIEVATVA